MSAEEVLNLHRDYEIRLRTDPEFHAQARLAAQVLDDLAMMGSLTDPNPNSGGAHGYAGYIVTAALHKHGFPSQAQAYNRGMADQKLVQLGIRTPGRNPYQEES